jgi:hypothetical protein
MESGGAGGGMKQFLVYQPASRAVRNQHRRLRCFYCWQLY